MKNGFSIRLDDLRFQSYIGVADQERKVGNEFTVCVECHIPADGFIPERIDTSISYADIHGVVADVMERQWLLLESAAKSIGDMLKSRWPELSACSVSITKNSVPIAGIDGRCGVTYNCEY